MSNFGLSKLPKHVAIIMDGNGRWAKKRNLPRLQGHIKGIERAKEIVSVTLEIGIPFLTLYAFSKENWLRPKEEVEGLLHLLDKTLEEEIVEMKDRGIRLCILGNLSSFPERLRSKLEEAERQTEKNNNLFLGLALSYSGREEILQAVRKILEEEKKGISVRLDEENFKKYLYTKDMPDPDLLIRTSGEMRISNFLLWQSAYTELYFTEILWPDFGRDAYIEALLEYGRRERRFGIVK